jgi:hypothetical protein
MRRRLFAAGLAAAAVMSGAGSAAGISATGAVQVTNDPGPLPSHSSPQIAVNSKPGELVVVESDVRGNWACTVHISTDLGRSWFLGGDPMTKPFNDCGFYAEYDPLAQAWWWRGCCSAGSPPATPRRERPSGPDDQVSMRCTGHGVLVIPPPWVASRTGANWSEV